MTVVPFVRRQSLASQAKLGAEPKPPLSSTGAIALEDVPPGQLHRGGCSQGAYPRLHLEDTLTKPSVPC